MALSIEPPRTVTVPAALLDGRYTVQRTLGTDACGPVVLATETGTNAAIAIQYLPADHPEYDRCLERFRRAVAVSRLVRHPNIVAMQDAPVDGDRNAYLIMEFVDGPSVRDVLASTSARSADRALGIALDVARALQALHDRDIIHQNLSPAHILLTKDGAAKVTGFGDAQIGRASSFMHLGGEQPGTPGYTSPEQESGLGSLDGRSDLYGLGAILYEMLAGEPYIRTGRSLALVRPDLTLATVALVNKLLERQAAFRYGAAADVARDLDGLLHPEAPHTAVSPQLEAGALADLSPTETPPTLVPPMTIPSLAAAEALPAPSAVTFTAPPTTPPSAVTFASPPSAPPPAQLPPARAAQPAATPAAPVRPSPTATAPPAPRPTRLPVRPGATETERPTFRPLPTYPDAPVPPAQTTRGTAGKGFKGSWLGVIAVIVAILVLRSAFSRASTPRIAPTSTPVPATRTAIPAARTATTIAAQPTLWTDPKGRITLRLPPGWRALPLDATAKPEDIVTLTGPNGVRMTVQNFTPTGTIDDQLAADRRSQAAVPNRTFTQGPATDVTIGGEAGKFMDFRVVWAATYTASSSSTTYNPYMGVEWLVDHGGKRYFFLVLDTRTSRAACDAIISSATFPA